MEILGFLSAIVIGLSLGLIGGGGSILTVPALVYLMGIAPVPATAYSLFVVGLTSLIGSMTYIKRDLVSFEAAIVFSIPSFIAVFFTRKFVIPALPDVLFALGPVEITKDTAVMILFAALMVLASFTMIRDKTPEAEGSNVTLNYKKIFTHGLIVGFFTGLLGAGGGFLIIPALVIFAGIPMKKAVGTSLLIIAIKSLIGFTGDLTSTISFDWILLSGFSLFAVTGIFIGSYLSKYISGARLKPAFGWFILSMGVYVIIKEVLSLN